MTTRDPASRTPLPSTRFDATGWRPGDALDYFHEQVRALYDVYPTADTPDDWNVNLTAWHLDGIQVAKVRADAHGARRESRHLRQSPSEFLRIRFRVDSGALVQHDGSPLRLDSSAVYLVDFNREMDLVVPDGEQISVLIPHAAIGYDSGKHPAHLRFGLDTGSGLVLHRTLMSLQDVLPDLRQDEAPALARGFTGMLQALLSGGLESQADGAIQSARSSAMRRFLDERLRDPALGLETLAAAFGASRATIFRDFAPYGGVERYILRRRLEAAFVELTHMVPRRGAVVAVAEAWGFTSIHHFSRLFRTRFGMPPSEAVGARANPAVESGARGAAAPGEPQTRRPIGDWFLRT